MARPSGREQGGLWGVWWSLGNTEAHHILHSEKPEPLYFVILHTGPLPVFPVILPWKTKLFGSTHIATQVGTYLEITSG